MKYVVFKKTKTQKSTNLFGRKKEGALKNNALKNAAQDQRYRC